MKVTRSVIAALVGVSGTKHDTHKGREREKKDQ